MTHMTLAISSGDSAALVHIDSCLLKEALLCCGFNSCVFVFGLAGWRGGCSSCDSFWILGFLSHSDQTDPHVEAGVVAKCRM